jgi:23S rRNA pseudouridine1911/1915/1917 synthase
MKKASFTARRSDESVRLDLYVSRKLASLSRNLIQKLIKEGKVDINGQQVKKSSYRVKRGDRITLCEDFFDDTLRGKKEFTVEPSSKPLEIIYKGESLIVVDKPAGICVYPSKGNRKDTLINRLVYKYSDLKNVGKKNRFGLVHRIDKDTSGIVLVALTNEALFFYSRQFEKREVEKSYLAVVGGDASGLFKKSKSLKLRNYLGRHHADRKRMAVVEKGRGKFASTHFQFLATTKDSNLGDISLIMAKPKTGRTHQIRVHLLSLGFPIVGDKIYSKHTFDRMLLHALELKIKMLSDKHKVFTAKVPQEFEVLFNVNKLLT